jgi:hypothetical protein
LFGLGIEDGFVWCFLPQGLQSVELLHRPAVMPLRLGLIAQQQGPSVGFADAAPKSFAQQEVAVLRARDFDIAGEVRVDRDHGSISEIEDFVEAGGKETGFQAGSAEEGLLGEGDALDGEEFLGVEGLVEGHEVVLEVGEFIEAFEADDGVTGGGESVFAGVLGGAGFAFRGTGAGRLGGIGAIGGESLRGDGVLGVRHAVILPLSELARGGGSV